MDRPNLGVGGLYYVHDLNSYQVAVPGCNRLLCYSLMGFMVRKEKLWVLSMTGDWIPSPSLNNNEALGKLHHLYALVP